MESTERREQGSTTRRVQARGVQARRFGDLALTVLLAVLLAGAALLLWLPQRAWSQPLLEMLVALSPLGMVAAAGAVTLAAARRRPGALLLAALLIAGHLHAHELLDRPWARPAAAAGSPAGLRIVSANLLVGNDHLPAALDHLASLDADVLLLQEVDASAVAALGRSALAGRYPHRVVDPRPGYFGSAILSARPLTRAGVIDVAGWPMSAATVRVGGRAVRIVNVHVPPPLDDHHLSVWSHALDELRNRATDRRVVLMGDFNATDDHARFRRLKASGFADALDGSGWSATWPADRLVPPLLRLDHALLSEGLTAHRAETLSVPGSDHRGVLVDVASTGR
ncbi:MAG: endonuclease/exonuclease/phosphatase family protein [Acidimicrobiales bacterium]|jgi:endonuclease/exonuclease/phosphatase (EEP) superfamily protein YafD|nr:endonuclease/exonuclease/phosphatase family protein [Acidimicrobiales bacterium]